MKWIDSDFIIEDIRGLKREAMRELKDDDILIRRFLLGELDEREREQIEGRFISDSRFRENVLVVEDDLVEDYLEDCLAVDEKEKFVANFLGLPRQRRKVRIAKSVKEYVRAEVAARSASEREELQPVPDRRRYFDWLRARKRILLIPVAAALTIGIVFGVIWLAELQRLKTLNAQEQSRRLAIEHELAELNALSSSGQTTPANQVFSVALLPISVRAAGAQTKLSPPADATVALLWLVLAGREYPSYQAVLQKVGTKDQFTIPNLHVENGPGGRLIPVRIPTHLLTRGLYHLRLTGVADENGKLVQAGDYDFMVAD